MPVDAYADAVMAVDDPVVLTGFPVPEVGLAFGVPRAQILAIRRELQVYGVSRALMPNELLLPVQSEVAGFSVVNGQLNILEFCKNLKYLIVRALTRKVLVAWVHRRLRDGVHVWFADVLYNHRNAELSHEDLLVIRGRDELALVVDEGNCVHGAKVLVIDLSAVT